jgi:uncharacterized protein (TIGR02466 family)
MYMIQATKLWATPFFTGEITRETNDLTRDAILAGMAAAPPIHSGDYDMNWITPDDLHLRPEFAKICEEIRAFVNQGLDFLTVRRDDILITCMWANVAPVGYVHMEHIHANAQYSGVVYLQVPPGAAGTFFRDPRPAALMFTPDYEKPSNEIIGMDLKVEPEECKICMWPAWLAHGVDSAAIDITQRRIVLSYNIMLRAESTKLTTRLDTRHL